MANEQAIEAAALAINPLVGDAMVSPSRLEFAREIACAVIDALYEAGEPLIEGSYHESVCKNMAQEMANARRECDAAITAKERAERERDDLARKVYVPGLWRCAKCNFELIQSNLNGADGTVTARDQPGDKCPNCDVPLWRVTERERHHAVMADSERWWQEKQDAIDRAEKAEAEVARLREALKGVMSYLKDTGNFCNCGKPECRIMKADAALKGDRSK